MPSPFPGMNPYLEQGYDWEEFYNNYISRMQEYLAARVGSNYFVKSEVRLMVHERSAAERRFIGKADVGIGGHTPPIAVATASYTHVAPMRLQFPAVESEKQIYLEIRDRQNRRLITVIELLSPSNKTAGDDGNAYLGKRAEVLARQANLVEIDLRRGGRRPRPPLLPECDYYALVSRYSTRPEFDFWPIRLREPLPTIPIPLNEDDPAIPLDLKAILDITYDAYAYGNRIYREQPEPPLSSEDTAWARGIAGLST